VVSQGGTFSELFEQLEKPFDVSSTLPEVEAILEKCHRHQVDVIPLSSARYPSLLKSASAPPLAIFLRVRVGEVHFPLNSIAVVGARSACVEICHTTSHLAYDLVSAGCSVVSGLALGVDGAAHRGALAAEGVCPTIAVMANGLDTVYPRSHEFLARTIVERGGILVSEYPPGTQPLKHHFLERNRIIAGLARGIVVVQAGERSGSLVTANYAGDFGRDVFVLEGSDEHDQRYRGSARLCEEGAIPIRDATRVLAEYGLNKEPDDNQWLTINRQELRRLSNGSTERILRWELKGDLVKLSDDRISIRKTVLG
jgi:DNA processing protein